jgi:ectoine hydroxylase-related dioxygenase (phytanoyl-CoA dioxygenase family)
MSAQPSAPTSYDGHVARLKRDGYTIVENLLDATTLAEVRAGVAPLMGRHRGRNPFEGLTTERVYTLVGRGAVFERIAADETVLALAGHFLAPHFLLSAAQAIQIHPGEAEQGLHTDDSFYKVARPRAALSVSMICAIDDFTAENGATLIVPGSHTWGTIDQSSLAKAQAEKRSVVMKAGSAIVFPGTLVHGGGANKSNAPRLAITYQYCEGWLRQQENFFLAIPRDIAKTMPPRVRELVGYSIWPPFMGMVTAYHPERVFDDDFVPPVAAEPRS